MKECDVEYVNEFLDVIENFVPERVVLFTEYDYVC